ncbi:DUF1983 domain-containing protein, partial [Salmonella enterica]|nr:DUF1983 domain-containing protein [Salmonella enterica]
MKIGVLDDGRYYVAGIGMGIENTTEGIQSQILLTAQQIALVNPSDGNTTPMFLARDNQIFMNETFVKSINVNGRFIVSPDGSVEIRDSRDGNAGLRMNNGVIRINDEDGNPAVVMGDLWQKF